jgi:hypothetical protein
MKKLFALIAIMAMVTVVNLASATTYTLSNTQLMGAEKVYDNPTGNATVGTPVLNPPVHYPVTLTNSGSGFSQAQIGYKMWEHWNWDLFDGNLDGYTEYVLGLDNPNSDKHIMVNLFMNTGWTDDPWDEENIYYQNTWTWLAPGETKYLTLDFATYGVVREHHTSGIGFNVGTNIAAQGMSDSDADAAYGAGYWMRSGDSFEVSSEPIPEPTTLLLMAGGLLGLAGYAVVRRKNQK